MNAVMLKSFKNGINIKLDPDVDFETLYKELIEKFNASAKFFGKAKLVISFEGRELSEEEEEFLINCINENTDITVTCVIGEDEEKERQYLKAINSFSENGSSHKGQFYKGSVKAGETIETDSSLINSVLAGQPQNDGQVRTKIIQMVLISYLTLETSSGGS